MNKTVKFLFQNRNWIKTSTSLAFAHPIQTIRSIGRRLPQRLYDFYTLLTYILCEKIFKSDIPNCSWVQDNGSRSWQKHILLLKVWNKYFQDVFENIVTFIIYFKNWEHFFKIIEVNHFILKLNDKTILYFTTLSQSLLYLTFTFSNLILKA